VDSRPLVNGTTLRKLVCRNCGDRYKTIEQFAGGAADDLEFVFEEIAKRSIAPGYTSSLTGCTYESKEAAVNDTVAELIRLYNE
jgi:hypothetical protein